MPAVSCVKSFSIWLWSPFVPMPASPEAASEELLAKAACLLFVNGQSSESLGVTIRRFGKGLGVEADILLRWGEVILFVDGRPMPRILPAKPTGVDMGRVTATLRIVDDLCAGRISRAEVETALRAVESLPPVNIWRFALLAALGAAALGVIFGASDLPTLATIAFSAGTGALVRRAVSHLSRNALIQPFSAAFIAGVVGLLAFRLNLDVDSRLALVCPCMVLVPGPHVLNGTIDLARSRVTIGSARLVFASLIILMISAGLLLALTMAHIELPTTTGVVSVPLVHDALAAGMAVAAYGTFFNMPWRMLPIPVVVGMVAHSVHWILMSQGFGAPVSSLAACLIVGLCITPAAARLRYPFAALAFASVVSMVPGVFLFDGAAALVELNAMGPDAPPALLVGAFASLTSALLITIAMTVGLIVPKMMFGSSRRQRPS